MVTDPNDKQRHKPSPKHTLEEVRKSLEDMVRNEFDGVAPETSESVSATDSSAADISARTHGSLQSLPRRKPVGIDTEQLLRSLKGLISDELAEGGDAIGGTERKTTTGIETEPPPVDAMVTQETPPADPDTKEEPVIAEPDDESALAPKEVPNEAENVTLGTLSEDNVAEMDLSNEFEGEAELLELEAMAEALAEETESPPPLAANVDTPNAETEIAEAGPITALEPETRSVQSWSLPPSLKVVDLPHTSGPLKAFAVYDPALGGEPDIGEVALTEPQAQTDTISEPPVFVSQWLDELGRQPSYSELGLLERAEKSTSLPTEPRGSDLEDELIPATATAVPTDISDELNVSETGVVNPQDKSKAGPEPTSEPVVPTPQRTDMDNLESPAAEEDVVDVSAATSQPVTEEENDAGTQLALDITGETEQSPESEPAREESAPVQSDEIADVDLGAIDTGPDTDHLHSDEAERAEKGKVELALASDDTSTTAELASESLPSEPASGIVGPDGQESVSMPSVDFGGDAPVSAEESTASEHKSTGPSDPEVKLAGPPATEPDQTFTKLSLADGPLLGPSHAQEAENDSVSIDLGEQAPETSDELSAPAPKEPREPSPSAKEKAPTRPSRGDQRAPRTGGIIARRREMSGVASYAAKEEPAPKRDKPPREIKTEKDSSVAASQSAPVTLADESVPLPKMGPAVFKLSDEPMPPPKEAHVPPAKEKARDRITAPSAEERRGASHVAKEKPPAPRRDKPPREGRTDKTPSMPTTFALNDKPPPTPKMGPAVFKLSDEPLPPPKEAHVLPASKEKAAVRSSGAKPSLEGKRATTAPASKMGPAVFKLSDEPLPPPKEAHVPPAAKERAGHKSIAPPTEKPRGAAHVANEKLPAPRRDKPPREGRTDKTPSAPKSGPATLTPKMGPAVFKLSDEPTPPVVKERVSTNIAREKKSEGPSVSARKSAAAAPKPNGGMPPVKSQAPTGGRGDDIPVLEDAVTPADRLRVNPAALANPNMAPVPSTARRVPDKGTPGARNLAVQVVARLNTELRKCGERALSPATVDRLQYLLREVLERGARAVDNSRKKR